MKKIGSLEKRDVSPEDTLLGLEPSLLKFN
jgi:hypothetical protein